MAKRIRISNDNITYNTLPGNSGEISNESGQLDDTIFGQNFKSNFPGLIGWTVNANGIFKGFAGYTVRLRIAGTSTVMTAEPCALVSGKTYRITDTAKRIVNRAVTYVVLDNAVAVAAANILSYDHLFGLVTFVAGYTPTTPITVTGAYFPTVAIGGSRTFTLTQTADAIDETTIPEAQANAGHRIFRYGLKTVSLDLSGVYALSNAFLAKLKARAEVIAEINPDNSQLAMARGFFRFATQAQSGDVGALEEETLSLILSVPDDSKLTTPFRWNIDALSTLSPAIQYALTGWQNNTTVFMEYLPNGIVGVTGKAVVTDISLTGGLEAMNEFTVNLQGSGELTPV